MPRPRSESLLSSEDIAAIETAARKAQREVAPRRDLIREGDQPRSVFLILEGWACRYNTLPDGRRQIVAFLVPGDLCDVNISVLGRADHSVGAITRLKVAEIGQDEFEALLTARPRVAQALRRSELVMIAVQREWTLSLGQRTAFERIAHLLCELYARLEAIGLAKDQRCDFPLTQIDLADATGLTPVHVNRTLQELRRKQLVELAGRKLFIPDMAALCGAALFNHLYLDVGPGLLPAAIR